MGNLVKIYFALTLAAMAVFSSCENADIGGMFISDVSVNQRYDQSFNWNEQHPPREISVSQDDYTIFCMGDSHVGGTDNLDIFLNKAKTTNAAAVVMVGDLTTGHAEDFDVFQQHLPPQDSLAWFPIAGNHDLYFEGWNQFQALFGSSTYLFTVATPADTDLYICLDTGSGTLGNNQLDWLQYILQTHRSAYRRCIVLSHVNLFRPRHTMSTNPLVDELLVLIDLFTIQRVDMVITGHDHIHNAQKLGNTTHIIMDALMDGLDNAGYLKLNVVNGEINYQFETL